MRIIPLFLLLPFAINAQKPKSQEKYAATITSADLKKHLYIVAGPEMEGRGTATAGEKRAATYISEHFRQVGLTPGNNGSFLMPFPLFRDTLINSGIIVNGRSFELNKDFTTDVGKYNIDAKFSQIVFIGDKVPDSAEKIYLTGRPVITTNRDNYYYCINHGAAAVLLINKTIQPYPLRTISNSDTYPISIYPYLYNVSDEMARSILGDNYADSLKSPDFINADFKSNIAISHFMKSDTVFANNVVGVVEGSDKKDEYLFITAHYDHLGRGASTIYYGADDDGSGTVTILELAEAFAKAKAAGNGPRRTVVFMTVTGEEKGLWGSSYYADHPIFPLEKTTADLNIDMVGRIDPDYKGDSLNYIYTIGENKLSSDLAGITDRINKKYSKLQVDRKFNDPQDPNRFYYRSDHFNFARKGVPIIFYFNGVHADYHQATDTPDKINYSLMQKRARLVFHTAWEIANRDEMLKRDIPLD